MITKEDTFEKAFVGDASLFPVLSIVDAELMKSVTAAFTAYQGFDALFHSTEGYIAKGTNLMSDMYALEAIRNIAEYLPRAIKDGNDIEARTRVAFGNTLSGGVMCLTLITSEHALEHALSAYHPVHQRPRADVGRGHRKNLRGDIQIRSGYFRLMALQILSWLEGRIPLCRRQASLYGRLQRPGFRPVPLRGGHEFCGQDAA